MSWSNLVKAFDKTIGMSNPKDTRGGYNRRPKSGQSASKPPTKMAPDTAAQFGLPTSPVVVDTGPRYVGPVNRSRDSSVGDEQTEQVEKDPQKTTKSNPEGTEAKKESSSRDDKPNPPGDSDSTSENWDYDEEEEEEEEEEETEQREEGQQKEKKKKKKKQVKLVHSPLLEAAVAGLQTQVDASVVDTYYKDLIHAPQYQKDWLLATLLAMLGRGKFGNGAGGHLQAREVATADATQSESQIKERLDSMEIRMLSLQRAVGHDMTDPLSQQGPTVGFGGGLPFGTPASNPNLSSAFSLYGSRATTMLGTAGTSQAQTESQQELLERLQKMGV